MDNKVIGYEVLEYDDPWQEFLRWVESTNLFSALKNVPLEVDYYIIRAPNFEFNVDLSAKRIEKALDLPREVLINFYKNSPYYHPYSTPETNSLEKILDNPKLLEDGNRNNETIS